MNDQRGPMVQSASSAVPAARTVELTTTESGGELVVYDHRRHQLHHLNQTCAVVWRLCDGRRSEEELVLAAQPSLGESIDVDSIRLALDKLGKAGLLDADLPASVAVPSHSRRAVMRRAAIAGAAVAITSVTLPAVVGASVCQPVGCDHANTSCTDCSTGQPRYGVCAPNKKNNGFYCS